MATAAFKSTTKRTPMGSSSNTGDAGSSNRAETHRRSRSLSRFSGRFLPSGPDDDRPQRSGRFINTVKGSGFPEISLDDLANECFLAKEQEESESSRGRSGRRFSTSVATVETNQRRGRSVSRNHGKGKLENSLGGKDISDNPSISVSVARNSEKNSGGKDILDGGSSRRRSVSVVRNSGNFEKNSGGKEVLDSNSRRRRSVSVARYRCSDSESDTDHSRNSGDHTKWKTCSNVHFQNPSLHKPTAPTHQCALSRSLSQKDLRQVHDGYSSYSSALTDDEAQDAHSHKNGFEKTIHTVYAQKKSEHPTGDGGENGLFAAMRTEVRHAFEQIRTDLEQVMVKTPTLIENTDCLQSKSSDALQAISEIRRNYTMKLEESEKRKQDLLAKLAVEEQRGHEISKIVRELLPEPKQTAPPDKLSRTTKKSNDRSRMSKHLTEEAEKYFEDFISNVEDTDFSSFDGEKSDASSTFGGSTKSRDPTLQRMGTEMGGHPARAASLPVEMDGVVLPWLQWEIGNENSPLPYKNKIESPVSLRNNVLSTAQEADAGQSNSNFFESSRGSWSPDCNVSLSAVSINKAPSRFMEWENSSQRAVSMVGTPSFDMQKCTGNRDSEDLLFERFRNRNRINSGGLILCTTSSL